MPSDAEMLMILRDACRRGILQRMVLSQPAKALPHLRAEGKPFASREGAMWQWTYYGRDNKARHVNLPLESMPKSAAEQLLSDFSQGNLFTTAGQCQFRRTPRGIAIQGGIAAEGPEASLPAHDRPKRRALPEGDLVPYLAALDIADERGRVFDRARPKYRQISRFVEIVADVADSLSAQGPLYALDLCCGKGVLTFAVYDYLTRALERQVRMVGVDRKEDVIQRCDGLARELSMDGLSFVCGDIRAFQPEGRVDLVVSLHACDTATDVALHSAVAWGASAVLSSPCCQHEVFQNMAPDESLRPLCLFPALRMRLAEQATDALRARYLQAMGYAVQALEWVSVQDSPKNLLLRALRKDAGEKRRQEALADCEAIAAHLGFRPALLRLHDGEALGGELASLHEAEL